MPARSSHYYGRSRHHLTHNERRSSSNEREPQLLTRNPVDWRRNLVLVTRLQTVDYPQHLRRVSPRASRIAQDQPNGLLGIDNVHAPDRQSHALGVHIGRVLVIDHVILQGNLALLVTDDGELEV